MQLPDGIICTELIGGPLDGEKEYVREGSAYLLFSLHEGRRSMWGEVTDSVAVYHNHGMRYLFDSWQSLLASTDTRTT